MFEQASRQKVRFETSRGSVTVEDLWDIPLITTKADGVSLDNIAKDIFRKLKDSDTETSFVKKISKPNEILQLKFDIVKHVIDIRLKEAETAEVAMVAKEKKQKLLAIIAQKEDAKLYDASLDELKKMVETL